MSEATFRKKAAWVMKLLMGDFAFTKEDAAAVLGNLGAESGLEAVQEIHPISGRGGFGWAQWTGPRRVAFETYCKRNNYDIASDTANYKFLFTELKGAERRAVQAVKAANTLENKVIAFEQAFERAGVKNYAGRIRYAKIALQAYEAEPNTAAPISIAVGGATVGTLTATAAGVPTEISFLLFALSAVVAVAVYILPKFHKPKEIVVPDVVEPPKITIAAPPPKKIGIDISELPEHLRQIKSQLDEATGHMLEIQFVLEPPERRIAMAEETAKVEVKGAVESKINWTNALSLIATALTIFTGGKLNLTAEQQATIVGFIAMVTPVATIIMRTFFSKSVVAQSIK